MWWKKSLLAKMAISHLCLAAAVAVMWQAGWLDPIIAGDTLHLVKLACIIFLVGIVVAWRKAMWFSRELDGGAATKAAQFRAKADLLSPDVAYETLREQLDARMAAVPAVASTLYEASIWGSIVGAIIALLAMNPELIGDVAKVPPMAAEAMQGVGIALMKSAVGIPLQRYLRWQAFLLYQARTHVLSAAVRWTD